MEFENKTENLYQEIFANANKMIPGEWLKIYIGADLFIGRGAIYFFFLTPNDNTLYYSADIPNIYGISEDVYSDLEFELYLKFKNLKNEFSKEKLVEWNHCEFIVTNDGKYEVVFEFQDDQNNNFDQADRINYFKYKHFGFLPDQEYAINNVLELESILQKSKNEIF